MRNIIEEDIEKLKKLRFVIIEEMKETLDKMIIIKQLLNSKELSIK